MTLKLVRDIGLPNVKVHLDTFHMIREENDIAGRPWQSELPRIRTCLREPARNSRHRHGAMGPPSSEALKEIGYDGCITIESFDPDLESVVKLCCIWRQLADSPEQLASEGLKFVKGVYEQVYGRQAVAAN